MWSDAARKGADNFGLRVKDDNSIVYREWAPNAYQASLVGDFSTCPKSRMIISAVRLTIHQIIGTGRPTP